MVANQLIEKDIRCPNAIADAPAFGSVALSVEAARLLNLPLWDPNIEPIDAASLQAVLLRGAVVRATDHQWFGRGGLRRRAR